MKEWVMTRFVNRFVISDHHLGHTNSWEKFKREDGSPLRPFTSTEEMNETMIERHNAKVKEQDTVYFLGDVVINKKYLELVKRMNGRKILVRGNHDIFPDVEYREYFRELRAYHVMNGMILSHIPIHPDSLGRFGVNIHGHTHANRVMNGKVIDVRYHCVCVEQTDFRPILFEDVIARIKEEGGEVGFKNGNGPVM